MNSLVVDWFLVECYWQSYFRQWHFNFIRSLFELAFDENLQEGSRNFFFWKGIQETSWMIRGDEIEPLERDRGGGDKRIN